MVAVQRKMSDQEKVLVRFILSRMTAVAYSNNMKPVYEKNVDRVMDDIFGVARFCKKLSRGTRNEGVMINLINACGLENLWNLCREGPHYNMLVTLVAMDAKMGDYKKEKRKASEAGKTTKVKKINKTIKKYQKVYKQAVHQFREIFDIKKDTKDRLLEKADNWLDRYDQDDYGGYLFDDFDENGDDSYESMVRFAEKAMRGNRKSCRPGRKPRVVYGAFNLGGNASYDDDDDLDYLGIDSDDEDEEDEDDLIDEIEALRKENAMLRRLNGQRNASARSKANFARAYYSSQKMDDIEDDDDEDEDEDEDGYTDNDLIMQALGEIITQNRALNDRLTKMERAIDLLEGDDDSSDEYEEVDISAPSAPRKRPVTRDVGDGYDTDIVSREDILREMGEEPKPTAEVTMSGFAAAVRVDKETAETDIDAPVTEDDSE